VSAEPKTDEDVVQHIESIVRQYEEDPGFLIPMMQDLQEHAGYLPPDALRVLAERLDLPLTRLYSVATFYSSFRLAPKGAHVITLCVGTVCYLKGAGHLADVIQEQIGCGSGETSADGRFTFQAVNCLGACALAPVMLIDGEYHSKVKPEQIPEILDKYPLVAEAAEASAS